MVVPARIKTDGGTILGHPLRRVRRRPHSGSGEIDTAMTTTDFIDGTDGGFSYAAKAMKAQAAASAPSF